MDSSRVKSEFKKKMPTPEEVEKKLTLSIGLFEAAFKIKKYQLQ